MDKKLGLKENWVQFTLLVIITFFVGGMVGIERTIFPNFAESEFGITSATAVLSFITAFGFSKAFSNYFTGRWANKLGRKNLLIIGWIIALPIPIILINATIWTHVIGANILLGISQGMTWSSTVVMKIDLIGEKDRGFAMGINEFAGYLAVGIFAFLSSLIAANYGLTPYPFYLGIAISGLGLLLSIFGVEDTRHHVQLEATSNQNKSLKNIFWETTIKDKTLSSVTQAGMINNLNDGMLWGLLPIMLLSMNVSTSNIGLVAAIYPAVWGIGQLFTGKMGDIYNRKYLLFYGMLFQGLAIVFLPLSNDLFFLGVLSFVLGIGTALVYPTFLTTIAFATSPHQRAESIGTFRLWRDSGYAFGAILSGILSDLFGISIAIFAIGGLTIISSLVIKFRMPNPKL